MESNAHHDPSDPGHITTPQRQNHSAHAVSLICFSVAANKSAGLFHSGTGCGMPHSEFEFKGAYSAT